MSCAAYAGGWKKLEPLWDRLIRADHYSRRRQRFQLTGAIAAALMLAIGTLGIFHQGADVPSGDVVEAALQVRNDAPVPPHVPVSPATLLICPFCLQSGRGRDFLSLAAPTRPARVHVRVVPR